MTDLVEKGGSLFSLSFSNYCRSGIICECDGNRIVFIQVGHACSVPCSRHYRREYFLHRNGALASRSKPCQAIGDFDSAGGGYDGSWNTFCCLLSCGNRGHGRCKHVRELKDPRKAIPLGTLSAVAISGCIYFYLVGALAHMGTPKVLQSNFYILVDQSAWSWFMASSILAATASSALRLSWCSSDPLICQRQSSIRPASRTPFRRRRATNCHFVYRNDCRRIDIISRSQRDRTFDHTVLFLATYAMINGVVLIEQGLGLVSFLAPDLNFHFRFHFYWGKQCFGDDHHQSGCINCIALFFAFGLCRIDQTRTSRTRW